MKRLDTLLLCLFAVAVGCASDGTPEERAASASDSAEAARDAAPPEVVARVGAEEITLAELDEWMKEEFFRERVLAEGPAKAYEMRSSALGELLAERILAVEAVKRGVSVEDLIDEEVAAIGPVTDDEVRGYWEDNRARMPEGQTFESLAEPIRQYLEQRRAELAVARIAADADADIFMVPPRTEVAATGPSLGPADAPVTIVEFSDFECPFCRRASPVLDELRDRYPDQLRIVYRHLPLPSHMNARPAAIASVCAHRQGRFWEFHDRLFDNQRSLTAKDFHMYADQLELDMDAFDACLDDPSAAEVVDMDTAAAEAAGIRGTPAFFVNGILVSGARPAEDFVDIIDNELATSGP